MTIRPVFYGALAIGIVGLVWFVGREVTSGRQREKVLAERLDAVEAHVSAVRRVKDRTPERIVRVESAATPASPEPHVDDAALEEQPVSGARQFETDEELWQAYADDFATEEIDPTWAQNAQREYLPTIQQALPTSSRLVSFECRSRFCRLQVVHESVDASNAFLMELYGLKPLSPLLQSSAGFRAVEPTKTPDGRYQVDVYLAGKGVSVALDGPT